MNHLIYITEYKMIHINIPIKYQKHYEYLKIVVTDPQFIIRIMMIWVLLGWFYVTNLSICFMKEMIKLY